MGTFIRKEWTRFVMRKIGRKRSEDFVLNLLIATAAQCFLAFSLPVLLAEKYAVGLFGVRPIGQRLFLLLKELRDGKPG